MKKISILFCFVFPLILTAQNSTDALRYSRMNYSGTARFNALGGSMGAIGGEASSILINPGGLGVYRNSEFTFTTGLYINDQLSSFRGNERSNNAVMLNLSNISYIGSYRGDPNGWKNYSFAIGYNRIANFSGENSILGNNPNSTIIDSYVDQVNQNRASTIDLNDYAYPFGPSQAYWVYLIDSLSPNQHIRTLDFQDNIEQQRNIETAGSQNETYFSFGGNYLDRLYLGASMGIQTFRFEQTTRFEENYTYDPPALASEFLAKNYVEQTDLITSGTGVNFKLGFIYRINNSVRIGGAIHSPTFFGMTETYTFKSNASFATGEFFEGDLVESNYRYRLRTPTRYNASLAYVFLDKGLLNVDYEFVDYSTARFNDTREFDYDYGESNREIRQALSGSHNLRLGAEYRLSPFVLRAGYRIEDNPYSENLAFSPDESRKSISLGTGFRSKNYNIDLTYVNSSSEIVDPLYITSDAAAKINQQEHQVLVTVGWKW